jgi:hypothetical protein
MRTTEQSRSSARLFRASSSPISSACPPRPAAPGHRPAPRPIRFTFLGRTWPRTCAGSAGARARAQAPALRARSSGGSTAPGERPSETASICASRARALGGRAAGGVVGVGGWRIDAPAAHKGQDRERRRGEGGEGRDMGASLLAEVVHVFEEGEVRVRRQLLHAPRARQRPPVPATQRAGDRRRGARGGEARPAGAGQL